ncbi:hypothetical protein PAXRUDRAFT_776902 [Paxillus rubicundulus Ve08.2h10]|uniref:Uncharacterized protein n=1 Tax=Paxillus rubicundulus Ve08.2h10 TaxID=930991 RepID=A0A0D0CQI7_9AGAM|nr:hypothetical protein PAXRUDRAFT_776902 [Paxillus rubicundulus Ve08.2h10]
MLLFLTNHLNLTSPFDACCFTAACLAMWAQMSLGEILSPWEKSFRPASIVCRARLLPPFNLNGSCKCHLPFTKVAKSCGEDVIIFRQCRSSDPITAVENHLFFNAIPPNLPLFSFFSPCCNSIWSLAGIPSATGHPFHISGTTELLLAGVPPDVVKAVGQWSLDTFLCYWHSLELLPLIYSENLIPHSH